MLTTSDIQKLKTVFVTRDEFKEEMGNLKNDFYTRFDMVMHELKAIRENMDAMLYRQREHSDQLENHEERLTSLESPQAV